MGDLIRILGQTNREGKGESQFTQPRGVCVNPVTKEVFVVDCNNHRIQVFHLQSLAFVRQIGKGTQGTNPGFLTYPVGVAMDEKGHLFVSDTNNHRIVVFNHLTGAYVRSIGSQGSSVGCLNCPYGVCVDPATNYLYIADYENNRVQVFDGCTGAFVKVIGDGVGSGPGQFSQPIDVCIDHDQDFLLVADYSNNRVQVLNKDTGEFVRSVGSSEGVNAFNGPRAVYVNSPSDLLFISDRENHRIQLFNKTTFMLIRHIGFGFGIGPGMFNRPMELCVDNEEGVLIVVDGHNHRVQIMELPELRKEKLRLKHSRQDPNELVKNSAVFPSATAAHALAEAKFVSHLSTEQSISMVRFNFQGGMYICSLNSDLVPQSKLIKSVETTKPPRIDDVSATSTRSPLFSQASLFLAILEEVSTQNSDESLSLAIPSLLALFALMQRGWLPSRLPEPTVDRTLGLLGQLHQCARHGERQPLLACSVELLKASIALETSVERMKKIFHDLLALLRRRYALKFDRTESDGLSLVSLSDFEVSLPLEILVAVVTLIMAIFDTRQSHFPTQENRKAHENDPLLSRAFREASEMLLGGAGTDFFMDHTKKRKSPGLPSSNAPSTSSAGTSLRKEGGSIDDFQISESIVALLTQTFLWKFAESSPSAEKAVEKMSYRTDMLTAFADHVEFMQRDFVQRVQQKENRLRGGRRIWDPSEPLTPGDLIDCMDKEKSWFESIVVDVAADGSIRVHFLGWAAKWDDTITEAERPIRLAPLNTHTRNWRGDLFEGGLIEVKCNDDVVNQKWMWGRITKLNVEESWVEIAYSFSSEPVVVKKAWLYGETICPVGMHTKDKSRAAASLITRPGKTVRCFICLWRGRNRS
jgi:DNA-binding beta-propeller fold protein YncE